ncbi:cobalt-precorrin-6X reductase [Neosynechococcus sphagnicola sy1]|uniref:Cobalt-precorrin-6X reductase n=1 Tax=Neosynechococcus sphagnicola sy1 TaxID=1497020 RepID=A0A098TK82_9CYAN|nr:cobalt-precorrin-6A reductase [Neosynechococcus sphagnicola]KGF72745.1 cobalt-precorrin-6X reductase [Neosynechococcus sphagnicola sy1]
MFDLSPSLYTGRLWLIGGTQESAALAQLLVAHSLPCTVSVTTATARSLYPPSPFLQVWVGQLSPEALPLFLQQQHITAILDASHPYAVAISQLAIAFAQQYQLPYLRYERPLITTGEAIESFESLTSLLASDRLGGERVLLTIGYRSLQLFQPWQDQARLFARILPSTQALTAAVAAGFTRDRLIALRPPISADLEQALWQQWQISLVVTKASGTPGGEAIKRQLATQLGIPLVVIARPPLTYPHLTSELPEVIAFCQRYCR